jgi:hypothetical protein
MVGFAEIEDFAGRAGWSRLLTERFASRIADWLESGKIEDADLDVALTPNARAAVDARSIGDAWTTLTDLESLVAVVSDQLGGDPALVEWAPEILDEWVVEEPLASILEESRRLVDAAGYAASRLAVCLIRDADWSYEGGAARFEVRVAGLEQASTPLLSIVGALLAGTASRAESRFEDVRFDGIDRGELIVSCVRENSTPVPELAS